MPYFTKSRFKVSLDCPTKLYYGSNKETYASSKQDDPFLKALAKGGFQVGKLAQCYRPEGIEVETLDKDEALRLTTELLKRDTVVIFEAAVIYKNLLVRVDILEKTGKKMKIIEVKSKSVDCNTFRDEIWRKAPLKNGQYEMLGGWKPYIYDVAFQAHVAKLAFPGSEIESYLMLVDRKNFASVDGLNQKFLISEKEIIVEGDVSPGALGNKILTEIDVSDLVNIIHTDLELSERFEGRGWARGIEYLAEAYVDGRRLQTAVGKHCKGCEFRNQDGGKKSGFMECWKINHNQPLVFDVWNFKGLEKALSAGKFLMADLEESDLNNRQWLQVEKVKNNDFSSHLDLSGLRLEYDNFIYPLHMIDFETCMVAIPFNKDMHPYEQIAFQFSHHTIQADGTVEHADEYINCESGVFPNYEFVRALKRALGMDNGTIFRYSFHENTVLKQIKEQLLESTEIDRLELIEFIDSITDQARRTMIDMCELVKKYYYSPATRGSNSIKAVLPAVLNESEFLKEKYSKPFYNSGNFKNHKWIDGTKMDPYKTLPQIFPAYDFETLESMMSEGDAEINNGGAALTAYAMLQFTRMAQEERSKIKQALLRYCELDTLAMVMIYEFWKDRIS